MTRSSDGRERSVAAEADQDAVAALWLQQIAYRSALACNGRVLPASMREFLR